MCKASPYILGVIRICLIFVLGLSLAGCKNEVAKNSAGVVGKAGNRTSDPGFPTDSADAVHSPFADQVLFYLDDYPVREDELRLFARDQLSTQHGKGFHKGASYNAPLEEILQTVPAYVRYYSLVLEARRRGIDTEDWFTEGVRLKRHTVLAPLMMEHLTNNAALEKDEILAMLPPNWVKMNFKIRVFPDMEVAEEAYRRVQNGESLEEIDLPGYALNARPQGPLPETGLIWPEAGFFDAIDDAYLFSLEVGDVSQPVRTGIGGAIVEVASKHEYTLEEQSDFLAEKRNELVQFYVRSQTSRIKMAANITRDLEALASAFYKEIDEGVYSDDIVATIADVELSYRQFRELELVAVSWIRKGLPRKKWPSTVTGYLNSLLNNIALGMEADSAGIELPQSTKGLLQQYSWNLLYREAQSRIYAETVVGATDDEIARYYEQNVETYSIPQTVKIQYYYSEDEELIDVLARKHRSGTPFNELTMNSKGTGALAELSEEVGPKTTTLPRAPGKRPYAESLYNLKKGQITMLKGPNGLYYLKILDMVAAVVKPLEEVQELVRRDFQDGERRRQAADLIEDMTKQLGFRWSDEKFAPMAPPDGKPSPELMERG